ncbi:zinc finger protein 804A isoform X2 [Hyperolius riggenbachi]
MFKSTTVTVHDHVHSSLQSSIVHPAERETTQLTSITKLHTGTSVTSILLSNSESSENNKQNLPHQIQKDRERKISFSFAFPKRTPVKLEASAAVFYDFNKDISGGHGLTKRSRFLPGSFSVQSSLPIEESSCPNDDQKSISACEKQSSSRGHASQDTNQIEVDEGELTTCASPDVCNLKVPLDCDAQAQPVNSDTFVQSEQKGGKYQSGNEELAVDCFKSEASEVEGNCDDHFSFLHQPLENNMQREQGIVSDDSVDSNKCKKNPADSSSYHKAGTFLQNDISHKRPSEDFIPVQSKDGSKILQWPSEMIRYTSTQPSISYSCNPLHFDFRLTKPKRGMKPVSKYNGLPHQIRHDHYSNNQSSEPNTQLDYSPYVRKNRKDTCRQMAKEAENLRCYRFICSCRADQKHKVSKYHLDKDKTKVKNSHRNSSKRKRRRHRGCKCRERGRRTSKYRHRRKNRLNGNCQSSSANFEQQAKPKDSFYSLKNLAASHQPPHAENDHAETELLRRPTLQIKQESMVWDADHKRMFTNQTESKHSENTGSFNYQSNILQIDHCTQNIAFSQTICSWSTDKISFDHEEHKTFLKHSCTFKRTRQSLIDEIELSFKRPRLCKPLFSQGVILPMKNVSILCKSVRIREAQIIKDTIIESKNKPMHCKLTQNLNVEEIGDDLYKLELKSVRAKEFRTYIKNLKKVVGVKLDHLCKSLAELKGNDQSSLCCTENVHNTTNQVSYTAEKSILPTTAVTRDIIQKEAHQHHHNKLEEQCKIQLSWDGLPGQTYEEPKKNCMQTTPQAKESQLLSTYKEAHMTAKTYATEQMMPHLSLPYQPTHPSRTHSEKVNYQDCRRYGKPLHSNTLPAMFKLVSTAPIQPCSSAYPMQVEVPFGSGSIATLQHILPQHLTPNFASASIENVKFIGSQHQFFGPHTQGITRTPFYQITVESPSLAPIHIMPSSVLCHIPVPLPPVPQTIFTPVHSQLPPLIPLHPLF